MTSTPREILHLEISAEFKRFLEREASRLNLTIAAYIEYKTKRESAGTSPDQFDRVVNEVFGRYGGTMRKLAQ